MRVTFYRKSTVSFSLMFVLLLTLLLAIFLPIVFKDDTYGFSGGTGRAADPFLISSEEDFKAISDAVNTGTTYAGAHFKQTCDLVVKDLRPAGHNNKVYFQGNYDGNNYNISYSVKAESDSFNLGLFGGARGATINNVIVVSASFDLSEITVDRNIAFGGVVAIAVSSTITNCRNSAIIDCAVPCSNLYAGGIVGFSSGSSMAQVSISECRNEGVVDIVGEVNVYVGGILGGNSDPYITIENCCNTGAIRGVASGNNVVSSGGILGAGLGKIGGCYNSGAITAEAPKGGIVTSGGIAGGWYNGTSAGSEIRACYNVGNIICKSISAQSWAGGILGMGYNSTYPLITNVYNAGTIQNLVNTPGPTTYSGGIRGQYGAVYNSFNVGSVTLTQTTTGNNIPAHAFAIGYGSVYNAYRAGDSPTNQGTGVSVSVLTNKSFYASDNWNTSYPWNFSTVWEIDSNIYEYPIFQWQVAKTWIEFPDINWEGTGTVDDPYLISTARELAGIAYNVNTRGSTYEGIYFKQTANIDLSKYYWEAIGDNVNLFKGYYDGCNFSIKNMKINTDKARQGLFGCTLNASISNIKLYNIEIFANQMYVGGIVGALSNSSVSNCSVDGYINVENDVAQEQSSVGGIVGRSFTGSQVSSCSFSGIIQGSFHHMGGIVGHNEGSISNCHNTGNLFQQNSSFCGGIVGSSFGGEISYCTSDGYIYGYAYVGSIAGKISNEYYVETNPPKISNCAAYGVVKSVYYSGGIIGQVTAQTSIANCSFVGLIDKVYAFSYNNENISLFEACYSYVNGVGYYTSGDFSGYTIVNNMNDGLPIQNNLYAIAIGGYTSEEVIADLQNKGFALYS